ncbi:MAG: TetR/AcrR family transcriptional regulator C-terminal domain-containing protein [Actinobacteria bacterium]|nr:TetR/AcrR family transcriptional regulator C-terminal domain-containing protein [Actinomycetota bacterium]
MASTKKTASPRPPGPDAASTAVWQRALSVYPGRPTPTATEIAVKGFEVADAEGLAAVSVKRVAGRLGLPATRLASYLLDQDDLLDLMLDAAIGEVDLSTDRELPWDVQLTALAVATRALVTKHAWLATLLVSRPLAGPNGLAYTERALAALSPLDADVVTKAKCVNSVLALVCGYVRGEASSRHRAVNGAGRGAALAAYLTSTVDDERYPNLAILFAQPGELSSDAAFADGLADLLRGIAARLSA